MKRLKSWNFKSRTSKLKLLLCVKRPRRNVHIHVLVRVFAECVRALSCSHTSQDAFCE